MKIDPHIKPDVKGVTTIPRRRRRFWGLLVVFGPALLTAIYVYFLATPQYAAEAAFVIRGREDQAQTSSSLFRVGGAETGAQALDGYAVSEFASSFGALEQLRGKAAYDAFMARAGRDPLMRYSPDPGRESDMRYFNSMVKVEFSLTRQIVTVRTFAFDPEEARILAAAMIAIAEEFANLMNERAREDMLRSAQNEVDKAMRDLLQRQSEIQGWRLDNDNIDPSRFSDMVSSSIARVEEALIEARIDLARLNSLVEPGARGRELETRIAVLTDELQRQQQRLTGLGDNSAARQAMAYEQLLLGQEISTKLYESAVEALAAARAEADRQQKFLVLLKEPFADDSPDWPDGPSLIGGVFVASLLLWWIGRFLHEAATEGMYA